jgi:hypothetical protein
MRGDRYLVPATGEVVGEVVDGPLHAPDRGQIEMGE